MCGSGISYSNKDLKTDNSKDIISTESSSETSTQSYFEKKDRTELKQNEKNYQNNQWIKLPVIIQKID